MEEFFSEGQTQKKNSIFFSDIFLGFVDTEFFHTIISFGSSLESSFLWAITAKLELLNSVSLWRFVENWEFAFCCGWVGGREKRKILRGGGGNIEACGSVREEEDFKGKICLRKKGCAVCTTTRP